MDYLLCNWVFEIQQHFNGTQTAPKTGYFYSYKENVKTEKAPKGHPKGTQKT